MSYLRNQRFFWVLLGATLVACVLFSDSTLDFWAAHLFFHPNEANPWLKESHQPWIFFYHAAPWLTGILLLGALLVLVLSGRVSALRAWRTQALFVFAMIAVGPGLVINSILKPYWGRPRPREVIELKGYQPYQPFYQINFASGGKSFPCGHCSVGFSYGVGYFIFRRKKPWLARGFLVFSIVFGVMMGFGRIAAGGHFLSDVIFAGLIVYWVGYWLSQRVFDLEGSKSQKKGALGSLWGSWSEKIKVYEKPVYAGLGIFTLLALLMASPFQKELRTEAPLSPVNRILIPYGSVKIEDLGESSLISLRGTAKGFGFPGVKVFSECQNEADATACEVKREGVFSDYESLLRLGLPFAQCEKLKFEIQLAEVVNWNELPECLKNNIKKIK